MHAHDFVRALAIVMGVAAVTTVLFQRLRLAGLEGGAAKSGLPARD